MSFDLKLFDIKKYDKILARGLSLGQGKRDKMVCIEAAICWTLNMPHDDDPKCVTEAVRQFKIGLNDSKWSSPKERARGLRALGIAQLGSKGVVNGRKFITLLTQKIIMNLVPILVQDLYPKDEKLLDLADICRVSGTRKSALILAKNIEINNYDAAQAINYAAALSGDFEDVVEDISCIGNRATKATKNFRRRIPQDRYLFIVANLALEALKELKSPGCQLL